MKEGHNQLDDLFKSALDDYTKEPSTYILKKLNNKMWLRDIIKMNFKNIFTKSFFKYSSIIIVSVSTFFISTYIYNKSNKTNNYNNLNTAQNEIKNPIKTNQPDLINTNDTFPPFISYNNQLGDGKTNVNEPSKIAPPDKHIDSISLKSDISGFEEKSLNDALKNPVIIKSDEKNKKTEINNSKQVHNDNINANINKVTFDSTFDKKKKVSITYLDQKEKNKKLSYSDSNQDIFHTEGYKNLSYNITHLQPKPVLSVKNDGEITTSNFIILDNKNNIPVKQNIKKSKDLLAKYGIEIYGGVDYVDKILSSSLNSHIDERNNSEKPIYTCNFGADFKSTIKNTFVQAGVNMSTFGENNTFTSVTLSIDTSASHFHYDYHQYFIIDTIGWSWDSAHFDSIPILDSTVFNQVDSNWVKVYDSINKENTNKYKNRLNYFEIPVLIGLNFGNSPLKFNLATGVSFGFLTNSKGKLIRPYSNDLIDFNKNNFPLSKIIYNYLLRAGCYYRYNDKCSLFLRAAFKYNINSIFDKSYPVNQKYYTIGIQAGLYFDL